MANSLYAREIFDGLAAHDVAVTHVYLKVPAESLRQRIRLQALHPDDPGRDEEVRAWRLAQVARCVQGEVSLPLQTTLLDGELPVEQLADEVWQLLASDRRSGPATRARWESASLWLLRGPQC